MHQAGLGASVNKNGVIRYSDKYYETPSAAAVAVTGRSTNGWDFWHVLRDGETWKYVRPIEERKHSLNDHLDMLNIYYCIIKDRKKLLNEYNIIAVSLEELRNKLPQGFTSKWGCPENCVSGHSYT